MPRLGHEVGPLEGLPVVGLLVAERDELSEELPDP
jgi:hypothetical protein